MYKFDNNSQAEKTLNLAIGRLFKIGSRPAQPGDIEQYENLKHAAFEAAEYLGLNTKTYQPNANIDLHKQFWD